MIHVIVNPAAGQNTAVLATLNAVFQPAGIPWRVSITQGPGDARKQAAEAAADGVAIVAVYGGDGTVVEAASGLLDTTIPLAILPGGTANVVAQELGIPFDLAAACRLAAQQSSTTRQIDMGKVNDTFFLLRVGMGTEAKITEGADRDLKNQLGFLAYVWSAAQSLSTVESATYHLKIDGKETRVEGVTCAVINSGNLGIGNLQIAPDIQIDDGLLDVIVVQNVNLPAIAELLGSVAGFTEDTVTDEQGQARLDKAVQHWKGKEITIRAAPVQCVQYDGELLDCTEIHCTVYPSAVKVVVPQ